MSLLYHGKKGYRQTVNGIVAALLVSMLCLYTFFGYKASESEQSDNKETVVTLRTASRLLTGQSFMTRSAEETQLYGSDRLTGTLKVCAGRRNRSAVLLLYAVSMLFGTFFMQFMAGIAAYPQEGTPSFLVISYIHRSHGKKPAGQTA